VFYALQTLRQMFSPDVENRFKVNRLWEIPAVEIIDFPRFSYRGFMLDVARHFQPVEVIKKYIDLLSFYKINHFHLHLTDDQGWRIEIKKFPLLAEISSRRKETLIGHLNKDSLVYDGIHYGGFYTQEELRELVSYAESKHVTIIPEIELPGHTSAVLAAYPDLGCTGGLYEVARHWGVFEDVFCAGNEEVFTFLENILLEVIDIFPGQYIHIGGDECPKNRWKECPKCQARIKEDGLKDEFELQSWFIRRIEAFLNSHGRKIIGWDEITEGGLASGATVMYWRTWLGHKHVVDAANAGFKIIMTPLNPMYFNLYEDEEREITPLAYPGLIPLEMVYQYNPVPPELTGDHVQNIIGVQANLWSEYVTNGKTAEFMTFPRLCALAEIAWSSQEMKDYQDFIRRLKINSIHLENQHVNFSPYFNK
jgi:hexosaminidase